MEFSRKNNLSYRKRVVMIREKKNQLYVCHRISSIIKSNSLNHRKSVSQFSWIQDDVHLILWSNKCNCCGHCRSHWRVHRSDNEHFEHLRYIEVQKVEEQCDCTLALCLGFQRHYVLSDTHPCGPSILQQRTIPRRVIFVLLRPNQLQVSLFLNLFVNIWFMSFSLLFLDVRYWVQCYACRW